MTQTTSTSDLVYQNAACLDVSHDKLHTAVPPDNCLDGKIILVTGAGDGIGKAVAIAYAKYGATVLLLGKTQAKLERVYDQIESLGLAIPAILPLDLKTADFITLQATARLIDKEFGRLDGVLHNAGILGALTPLSMYDPICFDEVMTVNGTAVFKLTQVLLPLLSASHAGSVIFTTSGATHPKPKAFWGAYALSKQMVEGLCEIFTQETKHHTTLRFNCINPGATRTNMRAHAYPGEDPNRLCTPEQIVLPYIHLMSDESIGIKGQIIACQPKN